ncbi:MAG: hypothetical protein ACKOPE_02200, partial [Novosphingobium sp.]
MTFRQHPQTTKNPCFSAVFGQYVFLICSHASACIQMILGHCWGHRTGILGASMLSETTVRQAKPKDRDYK